MAELPDDVLEYLRLLASANSWAEHAAASQKAGDLLAKYAPEPQIDVREGDVWVHGDPNDPDVSIVDSECMALIVRAASWLPRATLVWRDGKPHPQDTVSGEAFDQVCKRADSLGQNVDRLVDENNTLKNELAALRARLADTPENVEAVAKAYSEMYADTSVVVEASRRVLAYLRGDA